MKFGIAEKESCFVLHPGNKMGTWTESAEYKLTFGRGGVILYLKRHLYLLLVVFFIASAPVLAEENEYRDLLLAEDYGSEVTYVVGHKNPDSDSVGSAIAYAYLLNEIGIAAQPVISGPVNNETAYALEAFGIETPAILDRAEGKQFVLVDHSAYSQALDGMQEARIVGIVDHHGIGDVTNNEFINVRSAPIGATASLVFQSYQECDVPIPEDIARVMLMSLLSDTRNLTRNVTLIDRKAYETLTEIAGMEDIDGFYHSMAEAIASYGDMTDLEIFQTDYKEYDEAGIRFGMADVNAFGEEAVCKLTDRMYAIMTEEFESFGVDMLFTKVNNKGDDDSENMMYMVAYGDGAAEVLQEIYGNMDDAGHFVFKENLSRKKDVVPAITAELERRELLQ